eukprot:3104751-Rhodomonas_salina.2
MKRQGGCVCKCWDTFGFVLRECRGGQRRSLADSRRPLFPSTQYNNNIGAEGVEALVSVIAAGHLPKLSHLNLVSVRRGFDCEKESVAKQARMGRNGLCLEVFWIALV